MKIKKFDCKNTTFQAYTTKVHSSFTINRLASLSPIEEAWDLIPQSKNSKLTWFENYLFNRKQHIFYDGHLSKDLPILRGVPQGSILGPILCLVHLEDIDNCLYLSSIITYADDTVIYTKGKTQNQFKKN